MRWLLILLTIKTLFLVFLLYYGGIALAPDEAQYWTWSQELDWGYYSKPPAIAWQIALTTFFFGNTLLGVRFGALVMGALISLAVYAVARAADLDKKIACWAGCIAACSPLGFYLSLAATTDGGMILFFTLATAVMVRGFSREEGPNYLLVGLCILVAALFKWSAYLFWVPNCISLLFFKKMRSWQLVLGIALSLCALLPSFYWNAHHEWATFRHVGATVGGGGKGNFLDFLGAQMGLLSPIFFLLLIVSCFFIKTSGRQTLYFLSFFPCALLCFLGVSLFKKMQPNWAAYLYPAALPLISWVAYDKLKSGKRWLMLGITLSTVVMTSLFALPWLQEKSLCPLPYACNPFRQSVGGERLTHLLQEAGYSPQEDFLFADKYQATSLLSFYSPEQKRAYFFNLSSTRNNQFSYWPQMDQKEVGKKGFFLVIENTKEKAVDWYRSHYWEQLSPYFAQVNYQGAHPLFSVKGEPVKYAFIFACTGYSGKSPQDSKKF